MSIAEIIRRLEAGETGREIDAAIACALDGVKFVRLETLGAPYAGREAITSDAGSCWADEHSLFKPYTTSLDAALQLVPPMLKAGTRVVVSQHGARISSADVISDDGHGHGVAKTPALALVIAALKTRAANLLGE